VVIPLATQHYMLLQRSLIYTGITRGKLLLVLIGQKKALGIAVRNDRPQRRYSGLLASLRNESQRAVISCSDCGERVDIPVQTFTQTGAERPVSLRLRQERQAVLRRGGGELIRTISRLRSAWKQGSVPGT
jgi:hypothetical protein